MNLDITLRRGNTDKPALVFIHGLGMDKNIWATPSKSRILGGKIPLKILLSKNPPVKDFGLRKKAPKKAFSEFSLGEQPDTIYTLFNDLSQKDYPVITWSQERPSGPIDGAVSELEKIMKTAHTLTKAGIVLIGHSRGGLIARKYLTRKDKSIRGLVTFSTPHKGSSIAKLVSYLRPIASIMSPLLPRNTKGTLSSTTKHVLDFFKSKALKELLPGSLFFQSLKDEPLDWIYYISVGGTDPGLLSFYKWRWDPVRENKYNRWFLKPEKIFTIPDIFERVIPDKLYPEEIKKGKGDGLVSAESSKIPWCNEHYSFNLNHAQILFDERVRFLLEKAIERMG